MARKTEAAVAEKKVTQISIVREARAAKPKLKPKQLSEYIKETYGMDIKPQRISMYKLLIRKKKGKRGADQTAQAKPARVARAKSGVSNISVGELLEAKKTIEQLGGEQRVVEILTLLKNFN